MKQLLTIWMVLACLSCTFAQGVQGSVTLVGRATIAITGHSVTLTWSASQNATSYNIYRGATHGGPYVEVGSGIVSTTYTDVQVTHNQTCYYVTTAVNGNSQSGYSNETVAVIP
jgi:fibronectin type 3 domain-containing protein